MKHWIRIGFIGLLLLIPIATVWASEENARIKTLEEAVKAAQTLYLQSVPTQTSESSAGSGTDPGQGVPPENPPVEAEQQSGGESLGEKPQEASEMKPEEALEDRYRAELNQVALEVAKVVLDLDWAYKKEKHLSQQQKDLEQKITKAETDFKLGKV